MRSEKTIRAEKGLSYHCTPTPPMLVNEIARLFHGRMRTYDLDGVISQDSARQLMRQLHRTDGCSQLDLVRLTHLKAPTVSVTLRRMEEEGLVDRHADALDMRVTRVYLSEKGREHNRLVHERLKGLDTELMQGFSQEETEQLLHFLERMRDNILPAYMRNDSEKTREKNSNFLNSERKPN